MGFCQSLSRTGLLIFNSLFALGGLAILIAGSVFYAKGETYGISAPTSIGIIVMGILVMFISLFGFFGALKRVKFLLWVYFILLLLILAGQIAVAVIAYTNSTQYTQLIADVWNLNPTIASDFQSTYKCCNVTGGNYVNCTYAYNATATITYNVTCNAQITALYTEYYNAIMISAAVLAAIEIFGLLFSLILACSKSEGGSNDVEMK